MYPPERCSGARSAKAGHFAARRAPQETQRRSPNRLPKQLRVRKHRLGRSSGALGRQGTRHLEQRCPEQCKVRQLVRACGARRRRRLRHRPTGKGPVLSAAELCKLRARPVKPKLRGASRGGERARAPAFSLPLDRLGSHRQARPIPAVSLDGEVETSARELDNVIQHPDRDG